MESFTPLPPFTASDGTPCLDDLTDDRGIPHDTIELNSNSPKVDPSYKSKRYRDKLRSEVKALESLLPVDRSSLHRKLDSQTVFRLVIAYFRTKMFLEAAGLQRRLWTNKPPTEDLEEPPSAPRGVISQLLGSDCLLQALEGFLLVVTADGTILYVSRNIVHSLGFNQVDLMHRCVYGIVHPDDHHELKMVLETSMVDAHVPLTSQDPCCSHSPPGGATGRRVSFLIRIKCFNGTTTGYLKMQCSGHMRSFPSIVRSSRTSNHVVFAFCRPFRSTSSGDPQDSLKMAGFWSKHGLDLRFKHLDVKAPDVIGYDLDDLEGESFYSMVHPEDLGVFSTCHKALLHTEDIQTMYFRLQTQSGEWLWLHTRGKVVFKNSKKYSIVFTHCPVREEDSTYIQQEAVTRRRLLFEDVITQQNQSGFPNYLHTTDCGAAFMCKPSVGSHSAGASCPSTWHSKSECHSPVFPTTSLPHRYGTNNLKEVYHQGDGGHIAKKQRLCEDNVAEQSTTFQYQPAQIVNEQFPHCPPEGPGHMGQHVRTQQGVYSKGHERAPQRRYLMQVNGIGVSGEDAPTTLFFQGQFTAFTEPPTQPIPTAEQPLPGWGGHSWGQGQSQGPFQGQMYQAQERSSWKEAQVVNFESPLVHSYVQKDQSHAQSSLHQKSPGVHLHQQGQYCNFHQRSPVQTDWSDIAWQFDEGHQRATRNANSPIISSCAKGNHNQSAKNTQLQPCPAPNNPRGPGSDSEKNARAITRFPTSRLICNPQPDATQEVTSEVKSGQPWQRPTCRFQNRQSESTQVQGIAASACSFRLPSPPQVTAGGACTEPRVKMEPCDRRRPKVEMTMASVSSPISPLPSVAISGSDLPAIGSFLEYLKDISG